MSHCLCRLCSSKSDIVDIYHSQLICGEQLRLYIRLASGIEIQKNDPISRMVCHRCCEIAVKLHKYRTHAVANDKLLKEKFGQPYTPPITDKDELIRVASKICLDNQSDLGIDGDPLDLLNVYINDKKLNSSDLLVRRINKNDELAAIGSKSISTDKEREIQRSGVSKGNKNVNSTFCASKTGDSSKSILRTIPTSISCTAANKVDSLKNSLEHSESGVSIPEKNGPKHTPRIISPSRSINPCSSKPKHHSVENLLAQNKSLILPTEVYTSDIFPVISLNPIEVSDWYASQFRRLKEKLAQATKLKHNSSLNFVEESNTSKSRLCKRNRRLIIDSSDSDDDFIRLPNKISRHDNVANRNSTTLARLPENTPNKIISKKGSESIKKKLVNRADNSSINTSNVGMNSSDVTQEQSHFKNYVETKLISILRGNEKSSNVSSISTPSTSASNNSMLQTILQAPNTNVASKLYSDFRKYGINMETSEPLIEFDKNVDSLLNVPVIPDHEYFNTKLVSDVDQIVCISDDESDNISNGATNISTTGTCSSIINAEKETIRSLFTKYLNRQNRTDKDCQTFRATNSVIHRTKLDLVAVQNMLPELNRHKIPIELEFAKSTSAHFVENLKTDDHLSAKSWLQVECTDICNKSANVVHKLANGLYEIITSKNDINTPNRPRSVLKKIKTANLIKPKLPTKSNCNISLSSILSTSPLTTTLKSVSTVTSGKSNTSAAAQSNDQPMYSVFPISARNLNATSAKTIPKAHESNTNLLCPTTTTTTSFSAANLTKPLPVIDLTNTDSVVQSNLPTVNNVSPSYILKSFLVTDQPVSVEKTPQKNIILNSDNVYQTYLNLPPTYNQPKSADEAKCKIRVKNISELMRK